MWAVGKSTLSQRAFETLNPSGYVPCVYCPRSGARVRGRAMRSGVIA